MAQPLGLTLVAGQYTVTHNAVAVGIHEGDASVPTIEVNTFANKIDNTDAYGRTPIDSIYLGMQARYMAKLIEYKAGSIAMMTPWGALGVIGAIGVLGTTAGKAIVMTAIAGTTASTAPATLTSSYAVLAPQFPIKLMYGPVLRTIPIMMDLFPYLVSTVPVVWTQT